MNYEKLLIIAICLFGLSPFLKAQMLNLNYQISLPMNQVKDFTDKASFADSISNITSFRRSILYRCSYWLGCLLQDKTHSKISDSMEIVMYIRLPESVSLYQYGAYVSYRPLLFYR